MTDDKTTETFEPQGVMTAEYAQARTINPSLQFRLWARAHEAIRVHKRFATQQNPELHLDFGAADGLSTKLLHLGLKATRSIGIEYSCEIACFSKQANLPKSCEVRVGDVTDKLKELEPSTVDVITALAFLEHITDSSELFLESARVLCPGGLFISTCPDPSWDKVSGALGLHKDAHHEQNYDKEVFAFFAKVGGLTPIYYHRFMNAFTGFLPYLRLPMSPLVGTFLDAFLRPIPLSRFTFVNQLFVARKP